MSDEVIIDGCNVAGCECYYYSIQTHCSYCNRSQYSSYCNDYPNCHFKQLQRAKAENEKLKERVKQLDEMTGIYSVRLMKKYRKALEEIKESCNAYAKTEDYVIDQTFNEFLENVFNKTNEVLND